MSDFRRRGFMRAAHGMLKAARSWHGEAFSNIDGYAAAGINAHGPLPAASSLMFEEYRRFVRVVAERLAVALGNGELRSFYFNRQFGNLFHAVPSDYWLKPESVDNLVRLFFEEFEIQSSASQAVPRDSIYFSVSELAELLDGGLARRRVFLKVPLDEEGKRELADELQSLSEQKPKLRRPEQFKMAQESPRLLRYRITQRDFREAARRAPLPLGRHPKQ